MKVEVNEDFCKFLWLRNIYIYINKQNIKIVYCKYTNRLLCFKNKYFM